MISDWAGYMLGGVPYTEGSSACETSLFDVEKGDWAWGLIDELSLPSDIFPEVERTALESPRSLERRRRVRHSSRAHPSSSVAPIRSVGS